MFNQIAYGGCYNPFPSTGCFPRPRFNPRPRTGHCNLPDANVGGQWRRRGCYTRYDKTKGFAVDLNNNGRYDRGKDGVLVFDFNGDGKYTKSEVSQTNNMMKAARGNYDFNGDGCVSRFERIVGGKYRRQYACMDRNRDGRLSAGEISRGGGKVWIDHSRGGGIGKNELHSPFRLPSRFCGGATSRLDFVDPFRGSQTSQNRPWWQPQNFGGGFGFGGFGGGGGGYGCYPMARAF